MTIDIDEALARLTAIEERNTQRLHEQERAQSAEGLTYSQMQRQVVLLDLLFHEGPARRRGDEPPWTLIEQLPSLTHISNVTDHLEAAGLIESRQHHQTRCFRLTPAGFYACHLFLPLREV